MSRSSERSSGDSDGFLDANLATLLPRHAELCRLVGACRVDERLEVHAAKSGKPVPLLREAGRLVALHSLVDPEKDGRRFLSTYPPDGFLVFLGLGAAYQILPYLDSTDIAGILVIDSGLGLFRGTLAAFDFRRLFSDPRVRVLIDAPANEIRATLLSLYLPALAGTFRTVPLRSRIESDEAFFRSVDETLRTALSEIADDHSVQTRFGKRWFLNTLRNLEAAAESRGLPSAPGPYAVVGAGPSLDEQLPLLRELAATTSLVATDTAWPALRAAGIEAKLVVSIDCQNVSYQHFMNGFPRTLALDLASPPLLGRAAEDPVFFASGHPLARLISRTFRPFPAIDSSGGNVAHAAVSLADTLGASEIFLFGVDFSYPLSQLYAKETYIDRGLRAGEDRLRPMDSASHRSLFDGRTLMREKTGNGFRYTTHSMLGYRERLVASYPRIRARIVPMPGRGLPIPAKDASTASGLDAARAPLRAALCRPRQFLTSYAAGLKALPRSRPPFGGYLQGLPPEDAELWMTLLPTAAALSRDERGDALSESGSRLMERTRAWAIEAVEGLIRAGKP